MSMGDPDAPPGARRVFLGLFAGYCLLAGSRAGVTVAGPHMMAPMSAGGFGLSKTDIGMIQSGFTMSYGPSKLAGSVASDLVSPKLLLISGILCAGAANLAFATSDSFGLFIAAWAVNGVVQGVGWPAVSRLLVQWFPKHQLGSVWGLVTMAGNLGQSVSPVLLSWLIQQFGWQSAFTAPAGLAVLVAAVTWHLIQERPEPVRAFKRPAGDSPGTFNAIRTHMLPNLHFWLLCLVSGSAYLVLKGLSNWTISFLVEARQFSMLQAATGATCFEVGGILGSLGAGALSDRLGGRRNLTSAPPPPALTAAELRAGLIFGLLVVPALATLWMTPDASSPVGLAVGLGVSGCRPAGQPGAGSLFVLGLSANGPKTMCGIAVREAVPSEAGGTAAGLLGLTGQLGASMAGYPLMTLQKIWGWAGVFVGLLGSVLLALVLLIPLALEKPGAKSEPKKDKTV